MIPINRLITDEAHYFRNQKSKTFKNIQLIKAKYRWALTGTPIQNTPKDIKTLFTFINADTTKPLTKLINNLLLRRTKKSLNFTISNIKKHTHFIQFDKSTNSFYEAIHNHDLPFIVRSLRLRQACTIPNYISKQKTINYQKLIKL